MKGKVTLLTSGMCTTIQDAGRFGFSKYGIPKSGAMDQQSYMWANILLGNQVDCAVLEWAFVPPVLEFSEATMIAITGAVCDPYMNRISCKMNTCVAVKKGDVLRFKNIQKGVYGFVGIKNGFKTEKRLGSRSFCNGITDQYVLRKQDQIPYDCSVGFTPINSSVRYVDYWQDVDVIECYKGVEFDQLSGLVKEELFSQQFTIAETRNRMAIQLKETVSNNLEPILSSPVLPGTVQLTPEGKLIVLMRDCQTTGGYPRVLQLSIESINKVAQKRMGESVHIVLKTYD